MRGGHFHIKTLGGGEEVGRVLLYAVPRGRGGGKGTPINRP